VAASAGHHSLGRQLAAQDHTVDVDVQDAAGNGVGLVDDSADRHDAGVVDQYVDRSELAFDLIEEIGERVRVGDIEFAVHLEAEVGPRFLDRRFVDVADCDLGAELV
jgi:hypothetical protein